ncbi:MAG: hypothetical protein FJ145_18165 [Deltaproteobacteria bacterium]|nr:hypothetical protein [Deltaproteobacteria bacterium]
MDRSANKAIQAARLLAAVLVVAWLAAHVHAATPDDGFYKGKTVRLKRILRLRLRMTVAA